MFKFIIGIIVGLIIGVAITGLVIWNIMPSSMLEIQESKLSFDETISAIETNAQAKGWQIPKIYDLQGSLNKAGYTDVNRAKVISICQPDHAYKILSDDKSRKVSAMMPCRIGIYEDKKGKIFITKMNTGLMSKMFGGKIEMVMGDVSLEMNEILQDL